MDQPPTNIRELQDARWRELHRRRGVIRSICAGALLLWAHDNALAQRLLGVDQAMRLCFPQGERFEPAEIASSTEDWERIQKTAGVKGTNDRARLWLAWGSGRVIGVFFADRVIGKHDWIDYSVALAPDGRVLQVEILEYRENYGSGIRDPEWRAQFRGKHPKSKLKLNGDISNISGATLSCRNVTDGVRRLVATYAQVVRPRLLAAGRLPEPDSGSGG